jgi:hypothetical protein
VFHFFSIAGLSSPAKSNLLSKASSARYHRDVTDGLIRTFLQIRHQGKRFTMTRRNLIALMGAAALAGSALAQKAATPKQPNKGALAEENVKELLILMDTNKNGQISKQEWMRFMEAEFDRLDKGKKGELDPKELRQSMVSVKRVLPANLGK